MARTADIELPGLAAAAADPSELVRTAVAAGTAATGARHGLPAAEEFRVVRFAGMEGLIERLTDPHESKETS